MNLWKIEPPKPTIRQIGNKRTGIIELPMFGGLTVQESDYVAECQDSQAPIVVLVSKLAQLIEAECKDVSDVEAYRVIEDSILGKPLDDGQQKLAIAYASQIEEIRSVWIKSIRGSSRFKVQAFWRFRLKQVGTSAIWDMHKVVYDGILQAYNDELDAEKQDDQPITSEQIKKR